MGQKLITDVRLRAQRDAGGGSNDRWKHTRGASRIGQRGFGQWCIAQNFAPDYVFAFAEFGTYGNVSVLSGLRAENQAHHWGRPEDTTTIRAKERLRELFCPEDEAWRSRTVADGVDLVEHAARGLVNPSPT